MIEKIVDTVKKLKREEGEVVKGLFEPFPAVEQFFQTTAILANDSDWLKIRRVPTDNYLITLYLNYSIKFI